MPSQAHNTHRENQLTSDSRRCGMHVVSTNHVDRQSAVADRHPRCPLRRALIWTAAAHRTGSFQLPSLRSEQLRRGGADIDHTADRIGAPPPGPLRTAIIPGQTLKSESLEQVSPIAAQGMQTTGDSNRRKAGREAICRWRCALRAEQIATRRSPSAGTAAVPPLTASSAWPRWWPRCVGTADAESWATRCESMTADTAATTAPRPARPAPNPRQAANVGNSGCAPSGPCRTIDAVLVSTRRAPGCHRAPRQEATAPPMSRTP